MKTSTTSLLSILILLSLLACIRRDKTTLIGSDATLEKKFQDLSQRADRDDTVIFNLDTLTDFSWDNFIVVTPYVSIEKLEKEFNLNLMDIKKTHITSDEISNVLAFVKNGQLVNYVELSRGKVDFSNFTDSNRIVPKANSTLVLIKTDNIFPSGNSVIKVRLTEKD